MSFRVSRESILSMRVEQVAGPRTGVIKSRALSTTSSRVIGLSAVPRTSRTQSDSCVPSVNITSTIAPRTPSIDARIREDIYFGALAEDGWIFHTRPVMHGSEGDRFIEEHDRDHMLHADIGHVAVADGIGLIGRNADYDFADIIGRELALLEKACEGIERSLNRRTDRPFFDVGAGNLVAFAEFIGECARVGFDDAIFAGGKRLEEIVRTRKYVGHSAPASVNQRGGHDCAGCRFAAKQEGLLHVLGVARPSADS